MKIRKLTALLLSLLMMLSLTAMVSAQEGGLSEPGVLPIWTGSEPYVLKVLIAPTDKVTDHDDNAYTKWIEEACNVDLQFEYLPVTDAGQKLNIMVTTGEKLPDIVVMGLDVATSYAYGEAGAFLNLRDYYDRGLAVNVDKAVAEFPTWNLLSNITNHDGSVTASEDPGFAVQQNHVHVDQQTWLDNLGLDMPTPRTSSITAGGFPRPGCQCNGDPTTSCPMRGPTPGCATGQIPDQRIITKAITTCGAEGWQGTASYLQDNGLSGGLSEKVGERKAADARASPHPS